MLIVLTSSCSSAQKKKEAQAHYKIGASHLNAGNSQLAYVEFQRAVELDSGSKEVHNALGLTYLKFADWKKAEQHFKEAVDIDSDFSEAHNNLCWAYYLTKHYESAVESCLRALENKLYSTPEKAFYNLGLSYLRLGKNNEAIEAFNDASRRQPTLSLAYYGLALAYNAKGMYGDAASAMEKAVGLDSRFQGDRKKAEREFSASQSGADQRELNDYRNYIEILRY